MGGDFKGFVLSVLLIAICCFFSVVVKKCFRKCGCSADVCNEISRKSVHIGMSFWWFIYYRFFSSALWPCVGLGLSAAGAAVLVVLRSDRKRWGTVLYPVSVIICILLSEFVFRNRLAVCPAVFGMGLGDGLAALFGIMLGKKFIPFSKHKTVIGSLVMFAVVFTTVIIVPPAGLAHTGATEPSALIASSAVSSAFLIALCASIAEAYTPFGLDNLSVPVVICILWSII